MSEENAEDVTDGDATKDNKNEQLIAGYDKFDDFIKVNHI